MLKSMLSMSFVDEIIHQNDLEEDALNLALFSRTLRRRSLVPFVNIQHQNVGIDRGRVGQTSRQTLPIDSSAATSV